MIMSHPPRSTSMGLGIRVPGLVISPYARESYIDNTTYSFESWLKIVEERFDVHPMTARDTHANDMLNAFDFTQVPRSPVVLYVLMVQPIPACTDHRPLISIIRKGRLNEVR